MTAGCHASRTATSALFSITSFVLYMAGPLTGYLSKRVGPKVMAGLGAAGMGTSPVVAAAIGRIRVGYVTDGIAIGLSAASSPK